MITITETAGGLTFNVYVQPRASTCAIVGAHQDALKIRLTAPPVEGAANKQCIELLAKALAVSKSHLTITGGLSSRHKQIRLESDHSADQKRLKTRLQELAIGSIR
jgi:uncharacterized protein (TIGR00251 family)